MAARIAIDHAASYRGGVTTRMDRTIPSSEGQLGVNHPLRGSALRTLRDRSRHLDRNNTLFSSSLDRAVENIIGRDVVLQVRTKDQQWAKAVEARWRDWADSECDFRELNPFSELLRLDQRAVFRDGDTGLILVDRGGRPYLQAIEGDAIESPVGKMTEVIDGIRWGSRGQPLTYYVKQTDAFTGRSSYFEIPARSFVFDMRMSRHSQVRGEPVASQSFWVFDHLDGFLEATITAARAGACQALLVKRHNSSRWPAGLSTTTSDAGGTDRPQLSLEPLSVQYLEPDEDVSAFNPSFPQANIDIAVATFSRLLGLNMGLALEQVTLDFSRVSYLSSRAMRLQADATANIYRDRTDKRKLRRIYRWWLDRMISTGQVPAPADEDEAYAHEWVYEPRAWVDPDKDVKAALIEVDMGLTTMATLCKERGREYAENIEARKQEIKAARRAGVPMVMSTNTRHPQLGVGATGDPLGYEQQATPQQAPEPAPDESGDDQPEDDGGDDEPTNTEGNDE
jgi:lambda family phage portal protein